VSTTDGLVRMLQRAMAPLTTRLSMVVSRLVVDAVNDAAKRQGLRVLVLADEVIDGVEHMQPGGLTHRALPGAEGILLCVGGHRGHPLAIGVSNRDARPTGLQPGETALYAAGGVPGPKVLCKPDGEVQLGPAPENFVALGNLVDARLASLHTFWGGLSGSAPLTGDALKALYVAVFAAPPASVKAAKVKAK
jgi:Gp45 protein